MLDYEPEIEESLKARYADALKPIYNIKDLVEGTVEFPGLVRKHVFDFFDGLRIIVFREHKDFFVVTHYAAGACVPMEFECIGHFAEFVMEHITLLRASPVDKIIAAFPDEELFHVIVNDEAAKAMWN